MHTSSSLHAELKTILFGLHTVSNEDLRIQIVDSDPKLAVDEIKKGSISSFKWLNVILDIDYYNALYDVQISNDTRLKFTI